MLPTSNPMCMPVFPVERPVTGQGVLSPACHSNERGVVLVLTLVLLVLISLLSVTSLHNVGSAESAAGNVRTTELATQASEMALRHCEASVLAAMTVEAGGVSTYPTTFESANILAPSDPPQWQNKALWDSSSATVFVLPLILLNQPGIATVTYRRSPECMVERLPAVPGVDPSSFFVITARGFGPEVPAVVGTFRTRPTGSEIWLQSNIRLESE